MQMICKLDTSWLNRKEINALGSAQGPALHRVCCEAQCAVQGG